VDRAVIAGETMSRELFYVAASRGREHVTVITTDKARNEESVGRSGARLSASELVRTMHGRSAEGLRPDASRGFDRGIRAVVEVARHVVESNRTLMGRRWLRPFSGRPSSTQRAMSARRRGSRLHKDTVLASVCTSSIGRRWVSGAHSIGCEGRGVLLTCLARA
jgi:hypothetical protein